MISWRRFLLLFFVSVAASSALALPLSESFEGAFPPPGWQSFENGDGAISWTRTRTSDPGWGYSALSQPDIGGVGGTIRQWLVTPQVYVDSTHSSLNFNLRTLNPFSAANDTLYVLLSDHGAAPSEFSLVVTTLLPGRDFATSFVPFSLSLQPYVGTTVYVAFVHAARNTTSSSILLDNVSGPLLILPPASPSSPQPPNVALGVNVSAPLSWSGDDETFTVDVYLSRTANDVQQLSPAARVLSNVRASSFQPPSHFLSNHTYYWRVVARNPWFETAGPVWSFTTGTGPLGGIYSVGGSGADFSSLSEGLAALISTGVSAPTVLSVAPVVYAGSLVVPPIPGASDSNRVTIRNAGGGAVAIQYGSTTDTAVVTFSGASFLTLDGIDVTALSGTVRHCILMNTGSHDNVLRNGALRGQSAGLANSDAVLVRGSQCDRNRLVNLTVGRVLRGFQLEGLASAPSAGNEIDSCDVDSVRCGIYLKWQSGCTVQSNDIAVNGGSAEEVDGISINTTLPEDTIKISANKIHGITTSAVYAVGIRVKPDSASAVLRIYNNFIYGFQNTGGSQVRAIYVSSGQTEIVANSILVNDVAAAGATYSIYIGTSATSGSTLVNDNILANRESVSPSCNLFVMLNSTPFVADYNVFHGTGSNYHVGHWGVDLATLADWRAATGEDAHSVEGDPGFISDADLHIAPSHSLASRNGTMIPYVGVDIDGDARLVPPCRGADEYVCTVLPTDAAMEGFVDLATPFVEFTSVPVSVIIQNRSTDAHTSIPVRLYYNNLLRTETRVDLLPLQSDTVTLTWDVPGAPSSGILKVQCFLTGDVNPANDSIAVPVQIIHPPLNGNYVIGSDNADYGSFTAAVNDLQTRGVAGTVVFNVQPGVYSEQVTIGSIPGVSAANSITFLPADTLSPVEISSATGPATVLLSGSRHVALDRIDITALNPIMPAVEMTADADSNRVSRAVLSGSSLEAITACGVRITGGNNDANELRDLNIGGFYYGIRLDGVPGNPDHANLAQRCVITSSHTAIRAEWQDSARIQSNVIHTGYDGASATCYGVYLGSQESGMRLIADGNVITGGQVSAGCCGVYSSTGQGNASIQNNMICGWNAAGTGSVYGILVAGGHADVRFNSIWMNDISGSGDVIALADTGVATSVTARNNVFQVSESVNKVWCILRGSGTLTSDYNAFSNRTGGNNHFRLGRSGGVDYSSLALWHSATGFDTHSLSGDPGFVDSLNLHVLPNVALLDNRGISVAGVNTDFDSETRSNPPDIGADEYDFIAAQHDFAVSWLTPPASRYAADSSYTIAARVTNAGSSTETDVHVRLFFEHTLEDDTVLSLTFGVSDTVFFHWATPAVGLDSGLLKAQSYLDGDVIPINDSATAQVTVIGAPLAGNYDVGGGNLDFATPVEAIHHLTERGVSATVALRVYPGTYAGALRFSTIPGADSSRQVTFTSANGLDAPACFTATSGGAVIQLDGVQYLTLDALHVTAAGACSTAVELRSGSSHNEIGSCTLIGADSVSSFTAGVIVHGDSCSGNTLVHDTVRCAFTGMVLGDDATGVQCSGNVISGCWILNARYGVCAYRQTDGLIENNEIVPGSPSPLAAACYGVYVSSLGTGGSVQIIGNRVHGFADGSNSYSNRAVGIYAAAGSGASVTAYNNFIYGFANAGRLKIDAIYLSSGTNVILHNSIRIDDVAGTSDVAGIYISTGSNHTLQNNIVLSLEDEVASYAVLQSSGGYPQCNGNDYYGTSPLFAIGRLNGTTYPTLAAWQAAGFDTNGISANPGFASASDLHIVDTMTVVNGRGIQTGMVTNDIDGDPRGNPPDIGADEYDVLPGMITGMVIHAHTDSVWLTWRRSARAASYHVYAGAMFSVFPSPENLIATLSDTSFAEAVPQGGNGQRFYVVTGDAATAGEMRDESEGMKRERLKY